MNTSDIKCIAVCMTVVGSQVYVYLYLISVMVVQLFPVYYSVLCTNLVSGTLNCCTAFFEMVIHTERSVQISLQSFFRPI